MNKSITSITLSILSLALAAKVQAQGAPQQWVLAGLKPNEDIKSPYDAQGAPQQWVKLTTIETGDKIFIDLASQVRLFDTGVKKNSFRTVTVSPDGKPLRGVRYQADCFKGTLALQGVERVDAQGSVTRQLPLTSADRIPAVPAKDTVAAEIWQFACSQF